MSAKSRTKILNSLVTLLKGLEGLKTTIELRNESSLIGVIVSVDCDMNTSMSDVTFRTLSGATQTFENFFVQGRNIRFVHIPDTVNIMQTLETQVALEHAKRNRREKRAPKPKFLTKEEQKEKRKKKLAEVLESRKAMAGDDVEKKDE